MKFLLILSILFLYVGNSFCAIINVPDDVETIQAGLDRAGEGDTVIVARGSWFENLTIRRDLVLAGNFILSNQKSIIRDTEIIGGLNFVEELTNDTEIVGLHFTGGDRDRGGAMEISNSYPRISHCLFTNNTAPRGGAVYCGSHSNDTLQTVQFFDCHFEGNIGSWGGCIGINGSNVDIESCTFVNNTGSWGGAIHVGSNRGHRLNVINCSFERHVAGWGNSARINEGRSFFINCIFAQETGDEALMVGSRGDHFIDRCTFTEITGTPIFFSGHQGGTGIIRRCYIHDNTGLVLFLDYCDSLQLEDCDISSNWNDGGGIIRIHVGVPVLTNCRIYNNVNARRHSLHGILSLEWHDHGAIIDGCLFFGNEAAEGGIIDVEDRANVVINKTTIANNVCENSIILTGSSHLDISNSILNAVDNQNDLSIASDTVHVSYSRIEAERINVRGNAGFVNLDDGIFEDNPGFVDPENSDFHLTSESPCIDNGDPESPFDPDWSRVDVGAFYCDEEANIEVAPKILTFIDIEATTIDSQQVLISNYGMETLHIEEFEIDGSECFTLQPDQEVFDLEPFASEAIWVRYNPDFRGEFRAELIIHSDERDQPDFNLLLMGNSRITPVLTIAPEDSLEFVDILIGVEDSIEVVFSNPGLESIKIQDVWIRPNRSPFTLSGPEPPFKVYPDSIVICRVYFSSRRFDEFVAFLVIDYNDNPTERITIPIHANTSNSVDETGDLPLKFSLEEVYPQPLNGIGSINFTLPIISDISLKLYDNRGRHIKTLEEGTFEHGEHSVLFNATIFPAGVYFARLEETGKTCSRKIVIVK